MTPIPLKHRKLIETDPYFSRSCLSGKKAAWNNRIVIHHALEYAGRQISEMWNYCPLLDSEHSRYSATPSAHNDKKVNDRVKLIAIERAGLEYLKKVFPKKDWDGEIRKINFNLSR
mgnify:CR=1 FL=1